ncbi:hypothetical protein PhaeoP30_00469 [Phaeobacter inhibens]|nr:hypothetical protein PhaeoP30_00469 [Phaeobacter inhibens]
MDCAKLKATKLSDKYRSEYRAWSNHKNRQKNKGYAINPNYELFVDFLRDVGPKPFPSASLDRINNDDPEYAPGKVRWTSKTTQTRNRSNTVKITNNGRDHTAAEIAEETGTNIATIRNRILKGWPFEEVKYGRKSSGRRPSNSAWPRAEEFLIREEYWPWLYPAETFEWERRFNDERPCKSRFYFYEDEMVQRYEDADFAIKDEFPILLAKRNGKLKSYEIQWRLDYRNSKVTVEEITDKRMLDLWERRELSLLALERLEKFRKLRGKYHQKPLWHDYEDW